ncbi:MAG: DUF4230 domain-containing protein [Bacteroidaceae bacterium]|nr:DUF4230 domain-containing protein [Bacteroidaceae bacterium]
MKERLWENVLKVVAVVMAFRGIIKKVFMVLVALVVVIIAVLLLINHLKEELVEVEMEDSIASIEEVRPKGEIYVCSAVIEDYTIKRAAESHLFWGDEEHSCVQTMTQKCSYVIDLDKVEYQVVDSMKIVRVKLPPVQYIATTQSASFLSDDSNFWATHIPNTNVLKSKVEEQIKQRFDTLSNRRKAERYAEDAVSAVMEQLGYEVEFVRGLERKGE